MPSMPLCRYAAMPLCRYAAMHLAPHHLLAGRRHLNRVDAVLRAQRGHGLEAWEAKDVADDLRAVIANKETHRFIGVGRFAMKKRDGVGARHRAAGVVGQMSLFDRETHVHDILSFDNGGNACNFNAMHHVLYSSNERRTSPSRR